MILIPRKPIWIVDFDPIWILMTRSYRRSQFGSNFDLFRLKDQFKDQKSQLNNQKSQYILKKSIYIEKVNEIWSIYIEKVNEIPSISIFFQ